MSITPVAHFLYRGFNGQLYGPGLVGADRRASFHAGDVIRVEFDATSGTLAFAVNGLSQGICFNSISARSLHPAVAFYDCPAGSASVTLLGSGGEIPLQALAPPTTAIDWTFDRDSAVAAVLSNDDTTVSNEGSDDSGGS